MGTTLYRGQGISPFAAGADLRPSAAEAAAWPLFEPYEAAKAALWLEPVLVPYVPGDAGYQPDRTASRFYTYAGATDAPGSFRMIDRCGDRIFGQGAGGRHPIIIPSDSSTSKPCLMFGAGGSSPNDLSNTRNGAIVPMTIPDSTGVETNNAALFSPDMSWCVAWKSRIPAPSGTLNGYTFGAFIGGAILGGASLTANNNMIISISQSTGYLDVRNQLAGSNDSITVALDFRDGAVHDYVVSYDASANTFDAWIDGAHQTQATGQSTGIKSGDSAALLPMVGGIGDSGGSANVAQRFGGFLSALYFLPSTKFAETAPRATIRALMATR